MKSKLPTKSKHQPFSRTVSLVCIAMFLILSLLKPLSVQGNEYDDPDSPINALIEIKFFDLTDGQSVPVVDGKHMLEAGKNYELNYSYQLKYERDFSYDKSSEGVITANARITVPDVTKKDHTAAVKGTFKTNKTRQSMVGQEILLSASDNLLLVPTEDSLKDIKEAVSLDGQVFQTQYVGEVLEINYVFTAKKMSFFDKDTVDYYIRQAFTWKGISMFCAVIASVVVLISIIILTIRTITKFTKKFSRNKTKNDY